jgi:hypothetical protein
MGDAQFNGTPEEWEALVKKNKKKQTAVEWLLDNLITEPYSEAHFEHNSECWDKAKEMEKEQHNITWKESRIVKVVDTYHEKETSFDDYYAQIFKSYGEA